MKAVPKRRFRELFFEIAENRFSAPARRQELRDETLGEARPTGGQEIFPRTDSSPRQSSTMASLELLSAITPLRVTR